MATKVDKRQVRKQKNAEAMGIDPQVKQEEKKTGRRKWSETRWKWTLFLIQILLIMFIIAYQ